MEENVIVKIVKGETYSTINIVGRGDDQNVGGLNAAVPELMSGEARNVIVNCQHLAGVTVSWLRSLLQLNSRLKEQQKQMRLIYVNKVLAEFLKSQGVDMSLRMSANLRTALTELGVAKPMGLDVNLINPFLVAAIQVLETQAMTHAKPGMAFKKNPADFFNGDISGVIALTSDSFSGSVIITFPTATFLKIMSKMMGVEVTALTTELGDGAAELTNIIFGQAKVTLNEKGFGLQKAIPSVVAGNGAETLKVMKGPRVVIPFETDSGPFAIEINVAA